MLLSEVQLISGSYGIFFFFGGGRKQMKIMERTGNLCVEK